MKNLVIYPIIFVVLLAIMLLAIRLIALSIIYIPMFIQWLGASEKTSMIIMTVAGSFIIVGSMLAVAKNIWEQLLDSLKR